MGKAQEQGDGLLIRDLYPSASPSELDLLRQRHATERLESAGEGAKIIESVVDEEKRFIVANQECAGFIDELYHEVSWIGDEEGGGLTTRHCSHFYQVMDDFLDATEDIQDSSSVLRRMFAMSLVFDEHDNWRTDTDQPEWAQAFLDRIAVFWHRALPHPWDFHNEDLDAMFYQAKQFGRRCVEYDLNFSPDRDDYDEDWHPLDLLTHYMRETEHLMAMEESLKHGSGKEDSSETNSEL